MCGDVRWSNTSPPAVYSIIKKGAINLFEYIMNILWVTYVTI